MEIPKGKSMVHDTCESLIIFDGDARKNDGEANGLQAFFSFKAHLGTYCHF